MTEEVNEVVSIEATSSGWRLFDPSTDKDYCYCNTLAQIQIVGRAILLAYYMRKVKELGF